MKNKKIKQLEKRAIGLVEFLNNYVGINNIDMNSKITHDDIKYLFPFLIRTSCLDVEKNIEKVLCGEVILVKDSKGICIPYINPKIDIIENLGFEDEIVIADTMQTDISHIDLDDMKLYELVELRKKIICGKGQGYFKITRKIQESKDYKSINYKRKKKELSYLKKGED